MLTEAVPKTHPLLPRSSGDKLGSPALWSELEGNGVLMLQEGVAFIVRLEPTAGL